LKINTWIEGSFSPVHKHEHHAETFVVLQGALAFFTLVVRAGQRQPSRDDVTCHVLGPAGTLRGIIVEPREWHAMAALPVDMGYPGELQR
jgi:hypothetical protein